MMVFSRKFSFLIFFFFTFFLIGCSSSPKVDYSCNDCNVLFLNVDILRADYVGLLGSDVDLTPNIDEFFKNAIIFEDVSSSSGATYLSATSVHTGTEAMLNDHAIYDLGTSIIELLKRDGKKLIDHFPTIAEVLSSRGYSTIALNQWIHSGELVNLDRGFQEYRDETDEITLWNGTLFEDMVGIFLDQAGKNKDRKFFMYFHPNALHSPFLYPRDRVKGDFGEPVNVVSDRIIGVHIGGPTLKHVKDIQGPYAIEDDSDIVYNLLLYDNTLQSISQEKILRDRQKYMDQIRYVDDELLRIFRFLEEEDLVDTTIIVLYANHGISLWEQGISQVGVPYQSSVHVPLLIRHPRVGEAIRIEVPISLVDMTTTVYEMLGIELEHDLTISSLLPLISGDEYDREFLFGRDVQMEFVRKGEWKLIIKESGEKELYNIEEDPHETEDMYAIQKDKAFMLESALNRKKIEQLQYASRMRSFFEVE